MISQNCIHLYSGFFDYIFFVILQTYWPSFISWFLEFFIFIVNRRRHHFLAPLKIFVEYFVFDLGDPKPHGKSHSNNPHTG